MPFLSRSASKRFHLIKRCFVFGAFVDKDSSTISIHLHVKIYSASFLPLFYAFLTRIFSLHSNHNCILAFHHMIRTRTLACKSSMLTHSNNSIHACIRQQQRANNERRVLKIAYQPPAGSERSVVKRISRISVVRGMCAAPLMEFHG